MLLNTADIPNLYENEERLEIIEKVSNLSWQLFLLWSFSKTCISYPVADILII